MSIPNKADILGYSAAPICGTASVPYFNPPSEITIVASKILATLR
jgi:hypothetical protein